MEQLNNRTFERWNNWTFERWSNWTFEPFNASPKICQTAVEVL